MTQTSTPYRTSVFEELRRAITNVAVPHHEPPESCFAGASSSVSRW